MRPEKIAELAWAQVATPVANSRPTPEQILENDIKNDVEVGKKYSLEVEKQYKLSKDPELQKRVQRLGDDLAAIANATDATVTWGDKRHTHFNYVFKVIEAKDPNAFSLPGGFVYVHDSLIKFAESDDELAGVLAHEISHAAFRHVAILQRDAAKLQAIQIPLILASILTGGATLGTVLTATDLAATALTNGWGQEAEKAADYGGFQFMAKSKYNPTGMVTFMERLAHEEHMQPKIDWGIYRTHPPSKQRADAIIAYMTAAQIPVQRSKVTTSFRASVKPADDGTVVLHLGARTVMAFAGNDALVRADAAVERINDFFDTTPELFELRAGEDGAIYGSQTPLLIVTHDDALVAKSTVQDVQKNAMQNLRASLFVLGSRVWERG